MGIEDRYRSVIRVRKPEGPMEVDVACNAGCDRKCVAVVEIGGGYGRGASVMTSRLCARHLARLVEQIERRYLEMHEEATDAR